jgi:hypothetical protein
MRLGRTLLGLLAILLIADVVAAIVVALRFLSEGAWTRSIICVAFAVTWCLWIVLIWSLSGRRLLQRRWYLGQV